MAEYKKICENCGKEYIAKSNKSKYCSSYCRGHAAFIKNKKNPDGIEKTCLNCGKSFIGHPNRKYCCKKCLDEIENKKARELHIQQRNKEFAENSIEGYDYVVCPICEEKFKQITIVHFRTHGINTIEELNKLYPNLLLTCQRMIDENLSGENNPMSSKNKSALERKQSSPYSVEHYKKKGLSEEEAILERQKFLDKLAPQRKNWIQTGHIEYWIRLGYTEEEAKQIIHDRSVSNGLEFYIKKYGEIEGTKLYTERILLLKKSLYNSRLNSGKSTTTVSKIAYKFCNKIYKLLPTHILYFGKNEKIIYDNNKIYYPDLYDETTHKIIEFYGDFWHANPMKYKNTDIVNHNKAQEIWDQDKERINKLNDLGFEVLVIWENEYRKNPEYFIQKAINFLNEK